MLVVLVSCLPACQREVDEGTAFISGSGVAESGESTGSDAGGTESGSGGGSSGGSDDESTSDGTNPMDMPSEDGSSTGTTGDQPCGNGMIDMGEQCDLVDLNGFTCEQLGYGSGSLTCDPITCTYDTSGCVPDMGGTSG